LRGKGGGTEERASAQEWSRVECQGLRLFQGCLAEVAKGQPRWCLLANPIPIGPSRAPPDALGALANQMLAACQEGIPAPVSYNVLLWREAMLMVPRSGECAGPIAIK
jgi:hypothetical protein